MRTERLDEQEFILMTPEEYGNLAKTWQELGGKIDDVGGGVQLFMVGPSTIFIVRVDMTS